MPAAKQKTPEEIEAMEAEVRAYRQDQAREMREQVAAAAAPLLDVIDSEELKVLDEKLPALKELARDEETFPNLGIHLNAFTVGLNGLRQMADLFRPLTLPDPIEQ